MKQIGDPDIWETTPVQHLWVTDKLLLARNLGYYCGPAGVACKPGRYIVRPCVNYRMMSRGATFMDLTPETEHLVPDGYFWCEVFQGRHLTFDYAYGQQVLAVEGFRTDPDNLSRFSKWTKIDEKFVLPDILQKIADLEPWFNIEVIGDKIIEVHFRYNDDFTGHNSNTIYPIWRDQFYSSACEDRIGFLLEPGSKIDVSET